MIYAYALTENRPLIYRHDRLSSGVPILDFCLSYFCAGVDRLYVDDKKPEDTKTAMTLEANPLRFVSKQLNFETKGLSIRYNDLSFKDITEAGQFLIHHPHLHQHIQGLRMRDADDLWPFEKMDEASWASSCEVNAISSFLRKHPGVVARLHVSWLSPNNPISLFRLAWAELRLKQSVHCADNFYTDAHRIGFIQYGMSRSNLSELDVEKAILPHNFRFCCKDEPLDEGVLEEAIRENDPRRPFGGAGASSIRDGPQGWMRWMKIIVEEGV